MEYNYIFTTDGYVPLSNFLYKDEGKAMLEFPVNREMLDYVGESIKVAFKGSEGDISYFRVTKVLPKEGLVVLDTEAQGTFTLVSDNLKHSIPVVTHWDQDINDGRGGFRLGGTDAPGILKFDAETDSIVSHRPIGDMDEDSPYVFNTKDYAFFEGEPEGLYCKVPSYECYIGENYSLVRVDDLVLTWLSNKVLKETGFPLISLNYPEDSPREDLPAFQIINNYCLGQSGQNPSLGTFILPPFWTKKDERPYPILFTGFYDNNENVYLDTGQNLIRVLTEVYDEAGGKAMGILWNGGGSTASRTFQQSVYENLSKLFKVAEEEYNGDSHGIIALGGSRGGITALQAAGNPIGDNYSVAYAISYNPIIIRQDPDERFMSLTCPMRYAVMSEDTGYRYSWMEDWEAPETGWNGDQQLLYNLYGSPNPEEIQGKLDFFRPDFLDTIKKKGTSILIHTGSHDSFVLKDGILDFCEELGARDIPFSLEFGYGFGHHNATDIYGNAKECLIRILEEDRKPYYGIHHYVKGEERKFKYQPLFFEGPKVGIVGGTMDFNMVGEAGTEFELKLYKLDDEPWEKDKEIRKVGKAHTLFKGTLPKRFKHMGNGVSYLGGRYKQGEYIIPGYYLYELRYRLPGEETWRGIPIDNVPYKSEGGPAILRVIEELPKMSGYELLGFLGLNEIGWGLSQI